MLCFCGNSFAPFSLLIGNWLARKGNWYSFIPLFAAFSRYDAVIWVWKLTPLLCGVWLQHRQTSTFPAHVLVLLATLAMWRMHRFLQPHGRSGVVVKVAFWSFSLVLVFQGYLIATESVNNPSLVPRFTVAFSFVLLSILAYVLVVLVLLAVTVRVIWLGPSAAQQLGGRQRLLQKTSLTASIWVEDYVKHARRLSHASNHENTTVVPQEDG